MAWYPLCSTTTGFPRSRPSSRGRKAGPPRWTTSAAPSRYSNCASDGLRTIRKVKELSSNAPRGVRVNTLVPGFFPAEQNRKVLKPDRVASIIGRTPTGRFGEPRELVGATLLLASERAGSFITGTEIVVDGGFNAMSI